CEAALVLGAWVQASALVAALLRGLEWLLFWRLNDFAYCLVTLLVLAFAGGAGGALRRPPADARAPRWPRDVLLAQAAWMYFATALMKLSPAWLGGGQLFVRHQYLLAAHAWPYPAIYRRCADSLSCNAALAWAGTLAEIALALALVVRPRRAL